MQKFISKEKLSKKAKRELNLAQRQTWSINPVSRKQKNKKHTTGRKPGAGHMMTSFGLSAMSA